MTVIYPEGTPTLGNVKVKAVVSVADMAAPKLATEINAATSVDLSCFLQKEGWAPAASTAKGTRKDRLCSKTSAEQFNRTTYTIGALRYVHDPTANDAAAGNEARELLQEGLKIYLIERQGLDAEDVAFAVADRVRTHYVELGPQIESMDPDDNGEFFIMQDVVYVTSQGPIVGAVAT